MAHDSRHRRDDDYGCGEVAVRLLAGLKERQEGDGGEVDGGDVDVESVRPLREFLLEERFFQLRCLFTLGLGFGT